MVEKITKNRDRAKLNSPFKSHVVIPIDGSVASKNCILYRAGPLMIAINFSMGTKYDCNDDDNSDLI